jgi:hypothetical protein
MTSMTVMAGRIRESEVIMVRLLNPCMSLGNGFPINKRRRVWPPYSPPAPVLEYVVRTAEQPQYNGTYVFVDLYNDLPFYVDDGGMGSHILFFSATLGKWLISADFMEEPSGAFMADDGLIGSYSPYAEMSGTATVSLT